MRKLLFLTLLFLCSSINITHAQTLKWCGTYVEKNNHAFIVISQADIKKGSKHCSIESYHYNVENLGFTTIQLDFNKNPSKINNWRKFDSHIIEIRGKINQNKITNARLIRDFGPKKS